jgi:DNA mismatch repair protein MutS2
MVPESSTLEALDWPVLRQAQSELCLTLRGKDKVESNDFAANVAETTQRYAGVRELWLLDDTGQQPPIKAIHEVAPVAVRASKGEVLEPHELVAVGQSMRAMANLSQWVNGREQAIPVLTELAAPIDIDVFTVNNLEDSFTPAGELSDSFYPELKRIRSRMEQLKVQVRSTLDHMLSDPTLEDLFHDRYITDRGGRLVIPVRVQARRRLGIVHDTSQSGETVFVEPSAVVDQQNELKGLEAEWRRTVARILASLSKEVGDLHEAIEHSLAASAEIDLAQSRAHLGRRLNATVPTVGSRSVVGLKVARHPILALRGVEVIPNSLTVNDQRCGIVLTGPNAGGKTITLKTLGLMALMVRAGLPIPAEDDSRLDWMDPIWAVVGDQQDVSGDLSTFSSHLVALRVAIERARPGALVLLDEIAIGTDPKQGAALAQAVVEHLVGAGARTIVTTHYNELKELAAEHPKMALMGAVFADGRPTFRMEPDRVGRSHALAVARYMGLEDSVIERAVALLDSEARRMDDLLTQIETEREVVRTTREEIVEQSRSMEFERARLDQRETRLNARRDKEDAADRAAARERLKVQERKIKEQLKALQHQPSMRAAHAVLHDVKHAQGQVANPEIPLPPAEERPLNPGDQVDLIRMADKGTVIRVNGEKVEVEVRGKRMRLKRAELRYNRRPTQRTVQATITMAQSPTGPDGVRTDSNTLDLRGMRVDEALDEVEAFLDGLSLTEHGCGYLLHGHGTGALKTALRQWLPKSRFGKAWRVGGHDEGGDAFTVVIL